MQAGHRDIQGEKNTTSVYHLHEKSGCAFLLGCAPWHFKTQEQLTLGFAWGQETPNNQKLTLHCHSAWKQPHISAWWMRRSGVMEACMSHVHTCILPLQPAPRLTLCMRVRSHQLPALRKFPCRQKHVAYGIVQSQRKFPSPILMLDIRFLCFQCSRLVRKTLYSCL